MGNTDSIDALGTSFINMHTNWNLPSSRLYSGAKSYCSVLLPTLYSLHNYYKLIHTTYYTSHTTLRTPIGTCRHPDYIPGRGHIVVNIIMSTNWHLPSFWLYSRARSYCSVLLPTTTYTNWHLPSSWLYSRARSYCSLHNYVNQLAPAVILTIFQGKVIL